MRVAYSTLENGTSLGASFNSTSYLLDHFSIFSIHAIVTGATASGTMKLQVSNDSTSPTNWTDITGSSEVISGTNTHFWNHADAAYRYVRVVYTRTSGTGTVVINLCAKATG